MPLQLTFPKGGTLISGGTGRVGEGVTRCLAAAGIPRTFRPAGASRVTA